MSSFLQMEEKDTRKMLIRSLGGILSIRWDEDKLNQMESLRGARMKIDEPKTPYVRSMKCDNLTEEERGVISVSYIIKIHTEVANLKPSSSEIWTIQITNLN